MGFGRKKQGENDREIFRARFPRPLSELISKVINPIVERRAGMSSDLIAVWSDLVGIEHAKYSRPQKLLWSRHISELDEFSPATLEVACDSSRALFFQHETTNIIQRVNTYFGFAAVDRVKIIQKTDFAISSAPKRTQKPISPEQSSRLADMTENVKDEKLRLSLERLGKGVFSKGSSSNE